MDPAAPQDRSRRWGDVGEVRPGVVALGAALTLAVFAVDVATPLGIAGGVPYIAPVYLAAWLPGRRAPLAVAAVCTALVLLGWWLSPPGADASIVLPNRALALGAVWTVALLSRQRKGSEVALAESEGALRAVLATTADGVLTLDPAGRVSSANPAAAAIFGYPEAELVGRPLSDLLGAGHRDLFEGPGGGRADAGAGGLTPPHEVAGRHRNGVTVPLEAVAVPVPHPGGLGYTVTVRDITDRRLLEQHLLRASDDERRAVGYSLHEELGQSLTGLSLISRQLERRLGQRSAAEAGEARELTALLRDVDRQALALYRTIAPLEASGDFGAALEGVVVDTARRHGVDLAVQGDGIAAPEDDFHAAQLCRLARDLVNALLASGGVDRLDVQSGGESGVGYLRLHMRGPGPNQAGWAERLRPLAYRARLIGARIEHTRLGPDEGVVECRWALRLPTYGGEEGAAPAAATPDPVAAP